MVYHPLLTKSYSNKIKYEKNFRDIQINFEERQRFLIEVTN